MIEKKFMKHNVTENTIREFVVNHLGRAGIGNVKLQLTPLGEKIIVHSSNPGLVVGKEGGNIKALTSLLKKNFKLDNPQIEISEVTNPNGCAKIVADRIAGTLERYGSKNFKGVMHKTIGDVLRSGVRGVEIVLSGKLPGSRAKSWRILSGYMKKCGDVAVVDVDFSRATAKLKSGVVGVRVKIMPSDIILPDTVTMTEEEEKEIIEEEGEEKTETSEEDKNSQETEKTEDKVEEKKETKKKKKTVKKKKAKKEEENSVEEKAEKSGSKKEEEIEVKENDEEREDASGTEQDGTEKQTE